MRKLFVFAVLCAVLFASICDADDKRLIAEQENVIKQTEESRAAADKEASEWEAHIEKLNSEVIPRDRFSHDPTKKAIISHKKSDHHVIAKSNAKQQQPHAKVRIFQHKAEHKAAKYLKHLDHLAEETLPQLHKSSQWHDQTADQVLRLFPWLICVYILNLEFVMYPSQMYAHRKAEVDAAFPASWNSAETKKTVVKKPVRVQGNKAWAESVAYRQNQMYKYQADRSKINELKDEMQTKFEHQKAAQQAAKELTHLSSISEEVFNFGMLMLFRFVFGSFFTIFFTASGLAVTRQNENYQDRCGQGAARTRFEEERRGAACPAAAAPRLACGQLDGWARCNSEYADGA